MSDYLLTVPEDIYQQAQRLLGHRVDDVLVGYLRAMLAPVPALPPDEEAELQALHQLSDDALWTIAREQMPDDVQVTMADLMQRNSLGTLAQADLSTLRQLVERGQRLMLRKSEAMAILTQRGHRVTVDDVKADD